MLAWYDNTFIEEADFRLGIKTHGLHYATSVFEGIRVYEGQIFAAEAHSDRLIKSAELTGMPLAYDTPTLVKVMEELVERTGLRDAYIRPIAWRGDESLGIYAPNNSIHVAIVIYEWPNVFDADARRKGIALTSKVPYKRPDPACAPVQAKAASHYLISVLNREAAEKQGFNDSLLADYRGLVAEASGANIFFEKDGQLYTPIPKSFLNGITRQVVMKLARERQITVNEVDISFEELKDFEHVFLTGTAYEVMPVRRIDDRDYKVGGFTTILQDAYDRLTHQKSEIALQKRAV